MCSEIPTKRSGQNDDLTPWNISKQQRSKQICHDKKTGSEMLNNPRNSEIMISFQTENRKQLRQRFPLNHCSDAAVQLNRLAIIDSGSFAWYSAKKLRSMTTWVGILTISANNKWINDFQNRYYQLVDHLQGRIIEFSSIRSTKLMEEMVRNGGWQFYDRWKTIKSENVFSCIMC